MDETLTVGAWWVKQFQKRDVETDNNRISLYIKKSNEGTNNLFPSFTESVKNVLLDCKSLVTRREWQNRGRTQGEKFRNEQIRTKRITRVEFIKNSGRGRIRSHTLRTYSRQKSIQSCPSIATRFLKFQSKTRERLSTRVISAFNVALNVSIRRLKTFLLFETETRRDVKIRQLSEDLYTCLHPLTLHFYTNNWFKSSMRNN